MLKMDILYIIMQTGTMIRINSSTIMRCCCGQTVLSLFDFSSTERTGHGTLSVNCKFIFIIIISHHSFIFEVERSHNEVILS